MGKYERDKYYHFVVLLLLNSKIFVDIIRILSQVYLPGLVGMIEIVRNALYVICAAYVLYLFIRYGISRIDMYISLGSVMAFVVSYILAPDIAEIWMTPLLIYFTRVYVAIILFRNLSNYQRLCRMQRYFLLPTIVYTVLVFSMEQSEGYIAISYNLMPSALLYMFYGHQYRKVTYAVTGILIALVTFVYGSRGAFLCGCIAIMLYVFMLLVRLNRITVRTIFAFVCVVVLLLVLLVFWADISEALLSRFSTSRTLTMLLSGNITSDSGRSNIHRALVEAIGKGHEIFVPHGLLADRFVVAKGRGLEPGYLTYPHHYVYEVVYQMGLPIATIFLGFNLYMILRWIRNIDKMDKGKMIFTVAFIPIAFVQLMVSSSYLISHLWGIAIGMLISKNTKKSVRRSR